MASNFRVNPQKLANSTFSHHTRIPKRIGGLQCQCENITWQWPLYTK